MFDNFRVDKSMLRSKLEDNRDEHKKTYEKAMEAYWESFEEALRMSLVRVRDKLETSHTVSVRKPVCYLEDFDKAITAVDWMVGETIELTEGQFERYVLNKWPWDDIYAMNTLSYTK